LSRSADLGMTANGSGWPGGKKVAVVLSVMLETWSDGVAPPFSIQATALKGGALDHGGIAWGEYGGKVGIWRLLRLLDRFDIRATFCPNARAAELYPEAVRQLARAGHGLCGHGIYQDQLLTYLTAEQQREAIRTSLDTLQAVSGRRPDGWTSSVLAWTPLTLDMLIDEKLLWYSDPTYIDVPQILSGKAGSIVGIPASDFSDHRVLRSNPRDYLDVYRGTFEHLRRTETASLLHLTLHCHWGGRPLMTAVVDELLDYLKRSNDAWFTTHTEISQFVRENVRAIRSANPIISVPAA
jgi:allantoinase